MKPKAPLIEEVDRLRRHRLDRRDDLFARLDAGRIEAIGAGVGEGLQPADRFVEVGPVLDEAFRARGEDDIAAGFVDCVARRAHAFDRQIEIVERIGCLAGEILDRQSGDAGVDAEPDVGRDLVRIDGIAALEIGIDRHVGRLRDLAAMREHHVAGHVAVRIAMRMRVTRTGRSQRLEAETLQIAGASDIPRVGNDEAAALMQRAKRAAFVGDAHVLAPGKQAGTRQCLQRPLDCNVDLSG